MFETKISFELATHPSELNNVGSKALREVLQREGTKYFVKLSGDDPEDRKIFWHLWDQRAIRLETLNGQRRGLASFDESLGQTKAQQLFSEIHATEQQRIVFNKTLVERLIFVESAKMSLAQCTEPSEVDSLHDHIGEMEREHRKAQDRCAACDRKLSALKEQLQEARKAYYQRKLSSKVRPEIGQAVERFNREIESCYKAFWTAVSSLLSEAEQAGRGCGETFVPFIDDFLARNPGDRIRAAELKVFPRLQMNKSKVFSEWKEVR